MRVHHLNCVSTCPVGGRLFDGHSESMFRRGRLTCHCLLVETGEGLVLIDTGLGRFDVLDPASRLSRFFLLLLRPEFREEMTAVRQVQRLGHDPRDVRDIVLSHLDFDHAGGLDDFPGARIHLLADERDSAIAQKTVLDRMRYRPQQWSSIDRWQVHRAGEGDHWFGFSCVRGLSPATSELLLVPLVGHTLGHAGVAVRAQDRWLLLAGDAYFFHGEMNPRRPSCTPGLRFYQWMMEKDRPARLHNQRRLRALRRQAGHEVEIFCSHDLVEFERLAGRPAAIPPAWVPREPRLAALERGGLAR